MEKKGYAEWIIQWFKEKSDITSHDPDANFFNTGLLNSFKTLELIMDIESTLKIAMPDSALTDSRFSSINGLADILSELRSVGNVQ